MHRHDAAVNALVVGTKKWFLFPPTQQNWGPDAFGMPVLQWVETVLPKLKEQGIGPIELVQQAGEVLFVPQDWGHAVLNLCDVVGISSQLQVTEHGPESLLRAMIYRFLGKDSVRGASVAAREAGEGEL